MIIISEVVIQAHFENLDLADIASRKVKNSFDDIKALKIKLKNKTAQSTEDTQNLQSFLWDSPTLPAVVSPVNEVDIGFITYNYFKDYNQTNPSIEPYESSLCLVSVKIPKTSEHRVTSCLRALGAISIKSLCV